ncbi:MAG: PAS domain S-box protein, partial [Chloroflexi bacterium]|nr:PAS domain S-box protein [Chloroflexota bacterium]
HGAPSPKRAERERTKEAPQESNQPYREVTRYDRFFALSPDLLCVLGFDGRFREVNPAWEQTLGFTGEELLAKHSMDLVHPEDRQRTLAAAEKLWAGTEKVGLNEVRYLCKGGSYRWLSWNYAASSEEQLIYCVARDITERKRAQQALRESEERYRDYYEHAPDSYLSVDPESGLLIECNQTAADMLGRRKDEIIGHKILEFYTPESHQRVDAALQDLSARGVLRDVELQVQRKDGTLIDVSLNATAVRDKSGRVVRSRCMWRDITERKRAEETLRESEERFRVSLMNSPVAVFNQDSDLRYTWIHNPVPGFTVEGILGKTDADLLPAEEASRLTAIKRQVLHSGVGTREEIQATVSAQSLFHDLTIEPLLDTTGKVIGITGASLDVTERKRMEQEIQNARERLEGRVERQMLRRNPYSLTFRELTVLHQVADGLADKEIAAQLGISPLTIHKHVGNILAKMNAASRTEAGVRAQREGLLD